QAGPAAAAPAAPAPEAPAAPSAPPPEAPAAAAPPQPAPPAPPAAAPPQGRVVEAMSAMRRGVMEHMRRSVDTSAHVTSAIEIDMSKVVAAREALQKEYPSLYRVHPH